MRFNRSFALFSSVWSALRRQFSWAVAAALLVLLTASAPASAQFRFLESLRTPLADVGTDWGALGVATGDVNGDGKLDLVATFIPDPRRRNGSVAVMLGNGDGTFQPALELAVPDIPGSPTNVFVQGVAVADFNRDGNFDILVSSMERRQLLYYRGQGNGRFDAAVPVPTTAAAHAPFGVQVADLNGDNILDAVTPNANDSTVYIYRGKGDGTFDPPTQHATDPDPRDIALADFNGDNRPDVAIATRGIFHAFNVLINNGAGAFPATATRIDTLGVQAFGLYAGDFNGDNNRDVVLLGPHSPGWGLAFVKGNGNGTFTAPTGNDMVPVPGSADRLYSPNAPLDFNNDGKLDLAWGSPRGENIVTVALGAAPGRFTTNAWVAMPQIPGIKAINNPTIATADQNAVQSVAFGDFNGDGRPDIAASAHGGFPRGPGGVSVLLQQTNNRFQAAAAYRTGGDNSGERASSVLGDFTGDGKLDIFAFWGGPPGLGTVNGVVPGLGDGSFGTPLPFNNLFSGHPGTTSRAADFDLDGKLDVAFVAGGRMRVQHGKGDGSFDRPVGDSINLHALGLVAGDVNGDGRADLVVARNEAPRFDVFLYVPGAAPQHTHFTDFSAFYRAVSDGMAIADFDRDGKMDLVGHVPVYNAAFAVFMKGNGNGTFQAPINVGGIQTGGEQTVREMTAADLNGDGNPDVAMAGESHIHVLLGKGNGTFHPARQYFVRFGAAHVAAADFDGDGVLDLVGSSDRDGIRLYGGNGDGTFKEPISMAVGSPSIHAFNIADLNGDGRPELVAHTSRHNQGPHNPFVVLLNETQRYTVLPTRGGDTGKVTLRLRGANLLAGAGVRLVRAGQADLVATNTTLTPEGDLLAIFDLTGKARGLWDVVIQNGPSEIRILALFSIEEAKAAKLWVDVTGPQKLRPGAVATYHLTYGNSGNLDLPATMLRIQLPKDIGLLSPRGVARRQFAADSRFAEEPNVATIFARSIPAGSINTVPIVVVARGKAPSRFTLQGRVTASAVLDPIVNTAVDPTVVVTPRIITNSGFLLDLALDITSPRATGTASLSLAMSPAPDETPLTHLFSESGGTTTIELSAATRNSPGTRRTIRYRSRTDIFRELKLSQAYADGATRLKLRQEINACLLRKGHIDPTQHKSLQDLAESDGAATAGSWAAFFLPGIGGAATGGMSLLDTVANDAWEDSVGLAARNIYPHPDREDRIGDALADCLNDPTFAAELRILDIEIVAAVDPNDKYGPAGAGTERYITSAVPLAYEVTFENLATATAPAQVVVITDQLDPATMNLSTLSLGPIGFADRIVTPPPGVSAYTTTLDLRPATNLLLRIEVGLDSSNNVLTWRFTSLDPVTGLPTTDATAGFLPPNKTAPEGQGFVFFTIQSNAGLAGGTQISNQASIVFDTNAAIVTGTWRNRIDDTPPTCQVTALSAAQPATTFTVAWTGTDANAGVRDYDVYTSDNGGPFKSWLTFADGTSAPFTGVNGHTYGFFCVARDGAGNVSATPVSAQANTTVSVSSTTGDQDGDTLPDSWEQQFGLDHTNAGGVHGRSADPDGDGVTNEAERAAGTHPRGYFKRYLAEGAASDFFDFTLALANPTAAATVVVPQFLKADGTNVTSLLTLNARSRATLRAADVAGLGQVAFSTVVESDAQIVVDRTMKWNSTGYGSHAERSIETAANIWYLAEGATHSGFDLFYLIQNPAAVAANVSVRFLLPAPATPITRSYAVPATSRFNIWVDVEDPLLADTDVSAVITSTNGVAIIVERAMYLTRPDQVFAAGHESAGITEPALDWFLAEGATGSYFDLFVLVANPNDAAATVEARFLLTTGDVITKSYTVAANSRFNIWVDVEDARLADTAVSTSVRSTNGVPIIVEEAMWWPGPTAGTWQEAHNSPGTTTTGTLWGLADGEAGGTTAIETYILIANTSASAGSAKVTLLFEDGTTAEKTFALEPNSRFNVAVAAEFPTSAGRRFGALVESLGATPAAIAVNRAMYSNAGGVVWAAGTNALATRLR